MSYILDALRKSDARRRMGEAPGLKEAPPPSGPGRRREAFGRGLLVVIVALCAVLVGGSLWIGRDLVSGQIAQWTGSAQSQPLIPADRPLLADRIGEPPAPPTQSLAALESPQPSGVEDRPRRQQPEPALDRRAPVDDPMARALPREQVISDPAEIETELARRMAEQAAASTDSAAAGAGASDRPQRRRQAPIDPSRVAEIERQVAAAEAQRRELERESGRSSEREAEQAAILAELGFAPARPEERAAATRIDERADAVEPWSPSSTAREYVRAWELPLSIRRNMPDLRLSIHVYSADETQRFVLVNGERYVVGDQLGDGARLVDIRREGAIVDFREYRFLLEP